MAQGQFLVRLLNGSTRCVRFSDPAVSCEDLKSRVFEIEGIPPALQRIVTGTREVQDEEVIDGNVGTLSILLRLRGGKGGFGSLLRASKARQKKTNNFDACRDMSGRRLRHVNAEKKIKEWQEEAPLRQLEATAMEFLTKKSKKIKSEAETAEELKKFRELAEQNAVEVQAAVLDGLKRSNKRKKNGAESNIVDKKAKTIAEDSDEDVPFGEPSSSKQNDKVDEKKTKPTDVAPEEAQNIGPELPMPVAIEETEVEPVAPTLENDLTTSAPVAEEVQAVSKVEVEHVKVEEPVVELRLEDVQSVKDLEALGLDRLKAELQQRGLKCGGSLAERAARLYLLKSTPLDKLDKKHFAAKPKSSK